MRPASSKRQSDAGHESTMAPAVERQFLLEAAHRRIAQGWTVERAAKAYGLEPHDLLVDHAE